LACGTWLLAPEPGQRQPRTSTLIDRNLSSPYFVLFTGRSLQGFDGIYDLAEHLTPSTPAVLSLRVDDATGLVH
jgi:hypothetical protein